MKVNDYTAEFTLDAITAVKIIITKEFLRKYTKKNMPPAGTLIEGDSLDFNVGRYRISLRAWDIQAEAEKALRQGFDAEKGNDINNRYDIIIDDLESQKDKEWREQYKNWLDKLGKDK
jgi:hypothetical protein